MRILLRAVVLAAIGLGGGASAGDAEDRRSLVAKLKAVSKAPIKKYQLRDHRNHGMDCLEVFQSRTAAKSGEVWGVYHSRRDGVFSIHLASSKNLTDWQHVIALDKHASQAAVWVGEGGDFLLAYEKDAPNRCWIRLRYYKNLEALRTGNFCRQRDLKRSLAPTAEGTPSFESVKISAEGLDDSEIRLRFHYFERARVDRLASGVLKNFDKWTTEPAADLNRAWEKRGARGNFGDRDRFTWGGKKYYLQEIQQRRGEWGTWGIALADVDGKPLADLKFTTNKGSRAFSNPAACWVQLADGKRHLVVTAFIHSRGSGSGEPGELLYVIGAAR